MPQDIAKILSVIRPGAQWSKSNSYADMVASWTDGVQVVPTQDEMDYGHENADSKLVLNTDATDTVTPHAGVEDIAADGVSTCTITITKKKADDTVLTTPTFLEAAIGISNAPAAGSDVLMSLDGPPTAYGVGEHVQVKEGATAERATIKAKGANDITCDLVNSYTAAATVQRCVDHNDKVHVKTTGGKLAAETVTLVSGVGTVVLTSAAETKVVEITAYDGENENGIDLGSVKVQFRA